MVKKQHQIASKKKKNHYDALAMYPGMRTGKDMKVPRDEEETRKGVDSNEKQQDGQKFNRGYSFTALEGAKRKDGIHTASPKELGSFIG